VWCVSKLFMVCGVSQGTCEARVCVVSEQSIYAVPCVSNVSLYLSILVYFCVCPYVYICVSHDIYTYIYDT
jgi:hypothetical protein